MIVSGSTDSHETATTFRAMEAGALAVLRRQIALTQDEPENGLRPSVCCLFRSVAEELRLLPPEKIAAVLTNLTNRRNEKGA